PTTTMQRGASRFATKSCATIAWTTASNASVSNTCVATGNGSVSVGSGSPATTSASTASREFPTRSGCLDGQEARLTMETVMAKIPLRHVLAKLTVVALATVPAAEAAAKSVDCELGGDVPIDREHVDSGAAAGMLGRSLAHALAELPRL